MHGVVSLLDEAHDALVRSLWAELAEKLGLRGVSVTPFPHLSYQIAEAYNVARLETALRRIARKTAPFQVETTGLGIFSGPQPVLYLPVVRRLELSRLQRTLWNATAKTSTGLVDLYHPDHWMPHITIGYGDVTHDTLAAAVRVLSERTFVWTISIDNLALIYDEGSSQGIRLRIALEGA